MLIRNCEILRRGSADVRIAEGMIAAIGRIAPAPDERLIDAAGGALLPGLHDHHVHLAGLAVRGASVWCGPPDVTDADMLASRLAMPGTGWIRAIGFHESILGALPDAEALDRIVPDRPLRMQHRSGRMWLFNTYALNDLLSRADPPPGLERAGSRFTGRLFDDDRWLRTALNSQPPDFGEVSIELARMGITGITDMSPHNDPSIARHFAAQIGCGALTQSCVLAGALSLADARPEGWTHGPAKLHLHENALPDYSDTVQFIATAHDQNRAAAIHCVTETELVFALSALADSGTIAGDRIEHASVTTPELTEHIARLGLAVCAQPHFVSERGDRYLADVEPRYHRDLYRLRTFLDAGIVLAGGSDAPFGSVDPWEAMAAAVSRKTASDKVIGADEALDADQALALFLADPHDLSRQRRIDVGRPADLCLLDRPWREAKHRLKSEDVIATIASGRLIHYRIDQPPGERLSGR